MRFTATILLALSSITLYAFDNYLEDYTIAGFAGYRQDSLNWNIAGPHNKPDILSELKWENLHMAEIGAYFQGPIWNQCLIFAEGDYAKILKGHTTDSDYEKNGRHGEASRFNCDASRGEAFDLSSAIGYQFEPFYCSLILIPWVGYSYSEQHLQMNDGHIVIFNNRSVDAYVPHLHSNYRTRWRGPYLGADIVYNWNSCLLFYLNGEYHWLTFNGKGHWNLRSEFYDDFQHKSYGEGFSGSVAANYTLNCNWSFALCTTYYYFHAGKGRDRTFIKDDLLDSNESQIGVEYIKMETRLNEVNWHSFRVEAVLSYQF